jgi:hypothetical protein
MKRTSIYLILMLLPLGMACSEIFLQVRENLLRLGTIKEIGVESVVVTGLLLDVGNELDLILQAHGHCISTEIEPTLENSIDTTNFGFTEQFGDFGSIFSGLTPETLYYVRAYTIDEQGIQYSDILSFRPGIVRTNLVDQITSRFAMAEGNWVNEFVDEIQTVGHCWSTDIRPTINNSKTEFNISSFEEGSFFYSPLQGLTPVTTYYIRSYAINKQGFVVYGEELIFITPEE